MSVVAFARLVREEIEQDLQSVETGILAGIPNMEDYRQAVGKRHGLKQALGIIEDTMKRFDEQE